MGRTARQIARGRTVVSRVWRHVELAADEHLQLRKALRELAVDPAIRHGSSVPVP